MIASQSDMAAWLYSKLPAAMRSRDAANGSPLQQFLTVSAVAFYSLHASTQELLLLVDAEQCPVAMLPQLGSMLGFEFPFDLTEQQQRAFIKFMVNIYRVKGTSASFKAVANRLIGNGFDLVIKNENVTAHTFDIDVTSSAAGSLAAELQTKLEYVLNSVTPAGLIPSLALAFFFDEVMPGGFPLDSELPPTDFELTYYKLNVATHLINGNFKLNTAETQQLYLSGSVPAPPPPTGGGHLLLASGGAWLLEAGGDLLLE